MSVSLTSEPLSPSADQSVAPSGAASDVAVQSDVAAQKELHQKIRNDPDYDDWEYGTEPLPHEAWIPKQPPASA